jgi:glutathione S-transferase
LTITYEGNEVVTLYYTPTSCSTGCHIALEESGAEYQAQRIKLHHPEEREKYRAMNPKGTVPALQIDGHLLTESIAILSYVAQRFVEAGLWPDHPLDQARCLSLMSWFASTVHIARRQFCAPHYFTCDTAAQDALRASGRTAFIGHLGRIDQMLAGRHWLVNDRFSVADCYGLVFYHWAVIDELDLSGFPEYTAFKDRMLSRPATRRVLVRERSVLVPA